MEDALRTQVDREKALYKDCLGKLKNLKIEIEHLQHLLSMAKVKLLKDFEEWCESQAPDGSRPPTSASSVRPQTHEGSGGESSDDRRQARLSQTASRDAKPHRGSSGGASAEHYHPSREDLSSAGGKESFARGTPLRSAEHYSSREDLGSTGARETPSRASSARSDHHSSREDLSVGRERSASRDYSSTPSSGRDYTAAISRDYTAAISRDYGSPSSLRREHLSSHESRDFSRDPGKQPSGLSATTTSTRDYSSSRDSSALYPSSTASTTDDDIAAFFKARDKLQGKKR